MSGGMRMARPAGVRGSHGEWRCEDCRTSSSTKTDDELLHEDHATVTRPAAGAGVDHILFIMNFYITSSNHLFVFQLVVTCQACQALWTGVQAEK